MERRIKSFSLGQGEHSAQFIFARIETDCVRIDARSQGEIQSVTLTRRQFADLVHAIASFDEEAEQ